MITLGLEALCREQPARLSGKRLGLLCNQSSVDRDFVHARDRLLAAFPSGLRRIFSPQHGFFCEKQDNMIESDHATDAKSGLPVHSLYGETRKPKPEWFADIDVLLVDLLDVGVRVYTFIWTVTHCLETAAETGTKVLILDRPNPVGGALVEGNVLEEDCASFVGRAAIPMRHGLTMGELALFCDRELKIGADVEVIPMKGWRRNMPYPDAGLPWVFPSPNLPTFLSAQVYPGQVLWEGTNISEGRGTTLPFELFGAPFVDHAAVLDALRNTPLPGCLLRPLFFEPTSGKWAGRTCAGFQLHVTDAAAFRPYRTSLALVQALLRLYPEQFAWKRPPYEYEFERLPMDLIIGSRGIREGLEQGAPVMELEASWQEGLQGFIEERRAVLLYD